ncbi:MAG: N-acetylglucosamine-6-phosphate deacetylase [Pirellulales bacterium]
MSLIQQGYVDLQVNGYVGIDFNDPSTSVEQLCFAAKAMIDDGVASALPTIITADLDNMCQCIGNVVQAMQADTTCRKIFRGIHIEGPFFPSIAGYIGAHPPEHALPSSKSSLNRLLDACQGNARVVTLAPEIDVDACLTRTCIERGCLVSAGHTDARLTDLERCIEAGLTLFTHLGNGCPKLMDRHDNIIYRALKFRDQLQFTLIADSFHIPEMLFRLLLDWIEHDRVCVVSDAISATGLGPGVYQLGQRTVKIGPDKAARDASGQHFVGAASSMRDVDHWLYNSLSLDHALRYKLLVSNPMRFGKL